MLKLCDIMNPLEKAKEFLLKTQDKNGSWNKGKISTSGPDYLQLVLALTSQAVRSLLYLDGDTKQISLGINFCYKDIIEESDPLELIALKLNVLNYSNADYIEQTKKKLVKILTKRQDRKGFWSIFPINSNLTNTMVAEALDKNNVEKLNSWLLKNKATDGIGWGLNETSSTSQVSFTANCFLCLMLTQNYYDEKIENFLIQKQMKDGGWPSSELTYPYESTIYGTSLAILSLLYMKGITKEVKKGINFLLEHQLADGSWGLKKDDKEGEYFTTYYAIRTLVYFNVLEKIDNYIYNAIENRVAFNRFIFTSFEKRLKENYQNSYLKNIFNSSLATTQSAIERRKEIINILQEKGEMDVSDVIDNLKDRNFDINKKTHLAQIKNDMKALVDLGIILENKKKYFLTMRVL